MKVKANCRINHNGEWHTVGEVFNMDVDSVTALENAVQLFKSKPLSMNQLPMKLRNAGDARK